MGIRTGKTVLAEDLVPLSRKYAWRSYDVPLTDRTLWADPDLLLPVEANAVYEVRFNPIFQGDSSADISFVYTFPAGALFWPRTPGPGGGGGYTSGTAGNTQWYTVGTSSSPTPEREFEINPVYAMAGMVFGNLHTNAAAGSFQVNVRQYVDTGTTTFCAGSYMVLDRLK